MAKNMMTPVEMSDEKKGEPVPVTNDVTAAQDQQNETTPAHQPIETKMSKNQLKKKRRWERKMEVKRLKKQHDREAKIEKAKAAGRDLEKERLHQQERERAGDGKRKRMEAWEKEKLPLVQSSFQVCLDCSYQDLMTAKEINSLAIQIRNCYGENKRSDQPCMLVATSLQGETLAHLQKVSGCSEWLNFAFQVTEKPIEEHFQSRMDSVVYLTSDSSNVLTELDNSKVYVIGGIVDRNRYKGAAFARAQSLGVNTARLPIDEHLKKLESSRVLTTYHVFRLLLKVREHHGDWKKALLDVIPLRKAPQAADADGDEDVAEETKPSADKPSS